MLKRRRGGSPRPVWWTTDQMLTPWLLSRARQQREEGLAARESRARVRSSRRKQESVAAPDVVVEQGADKGHVA